MSILLPGSHPPSEKRPIFARSGWRIPQEQVEPLDTRIVRIKANELASWRRGVTIRSVPSHPYNCVGMIFAARRAWIEIDHIYDILREDGYRRVEFSEITVGDVVLYKYNGEPVHVGLIVSVDRTIGISIQVLSKWGKDAEFIHFMENVPSRLGTPEEFYTERQT